MIVHQLKTWPKHFRAIRSGHKTLELRRNDRDFQVDDTLLLREWDPIGETYTGNEHEVRVTHVLPGGAFGLAEGHVAMSICPMVDPDLRSQLAEKIRAVPEPPYGRDGADEVAEALLPLVTSWTWLMAVLDEHYPPELFDGSSGDPGPQIVALAQDVNRLRRRAKNVLQEMAGMAASVEPGGGQPLTRQLEPPHPPEVARAAGALQVTMGTLTMAYRAACVLHQAGLLSGVQDMIGEFHRVMGACIARPVDEWGAARLGLIREELAELDEAVQGGGHAEIMRELADLAYLVYGTAVALGYDLDPVIAEVHRANMSKLDDNGKPILRPSDGKVLKGPHFHPPDVVSVLAVQRERGGAA